MMIYHRYISREIFASSALVTVAFVALFGFFDLIAELRDVGKQGYEYRHAAFFVLLTLPGRAYELLPIGVLIGSLSALTQFAKSSEMTVFRASGLSTWQLQATLLRVGLVFMVLTALFGEVIAPPADQAAQQFKLQARSNMAAREFRSGVWVKDGKSFINVRDVNVNGELLGVRVFEFDDQFRLAYVREAAIGRYVRQSTWAMEDVKIVAFSESGAQKSTMERDQWTYGLSPELLSVLLVSPERMSVATLYRYINYLGENQRKTDSYEIALWKKLVFPFANLVMLIFALPFAFMHDRRGNAGVKIFAGVMLGIGFHMLNGLFGSLAFIQGWSPVIGAVTPSLIFLVAAVALLGWTERR
ncbi:MAG: LPS export ABC transporter permease LptG [Rhodocyclaceae bacterium]|nr:LPS export ABC transporter permease LptG [Rhodocyclaceae bacterium]MBK6907693.1 LPS export ABC transporter permease LptG [Rhodocyclaceae bacterium]